MEPGPDPILGADWRALASRGLDDLSPPELEHALLEILADRAAYLRLLEDCSHWPERPTLAPYVPSEADKVALASLDGGGWRAVVLLDDQAALRAASACFSRIFVLDPLFDSSDLLYAAWHLPHLQRLHADRLSTHASLLGRIAPLLRAERAVLVPDHLPGSWSPRANWRRPDHSARPHLHSAWSLRCALVLLYWADRLDSTVCVADRSDVAQTIDLAVSAAGAGVSRALSLHLPSTIPHSASPPGARPVWLDLQRASTPRTPASLEAVACLLETFEGESTDTWRLRLAEPWLPEPSLLLARALRGEDPRSAPPLPRLDLRRSPLLLIR